MLPWQEVPTVSLRKEFVMLMLQPGVNRRALCRRSNVSPKIGYKLLHQYREEGEAGLQDRSRRACHSPNRTRGEIETAAVALRHKHGWGDENSRAESKRSARRVCHNPAPSPEYCIVMS
jgi:transposase